MQNEQPYDESESKIDASEGWSIARNNIINNFHQHFPLGDVPVPTGNSEGTYRTLMRENGGWDKVFRDTISEEDRKHYFNSELRLGQTGAEFYQILDGTIERLGIPMPTISEAINTVYLDTTESKDEANHRLLMLLLPIYVEMRKKGYNQIDLRG